MKYTKEDLYKGLKFRITSTYTITRVTGTHVYFKETGRSYEHCYLIVSILKSFNVKNWNPINHKCKSENYEIY